MVALWEAGGLTLHLGLEAESASEEVAGRTLLTWCESHGEHSLHES